MFSYHPFLAYMTKKAILLCDRLFFSPIFVPMSSVHADALTSESRVLQPSLCSFTDTQSQEKNRARKRTRRKKEKTKRVKNSAVLGRLTFSRRQTRVLIRWSSNKQVTFLRGLMIMFSSRRKQFGRKILEEKLRDQVWKWSLRQLIFSRFPNTWSIKVQI